MANLFDATNAPEGEPSEIVVGDYIQWKRSDLSADYPNDEYTATYIARITAGGASEIQLTGTASNGYYLFTADSETSADFVPGYYHWQLEIVKDSTGDRIVVDRGAFTAIVDLDVNNADPRTFAEIMLDKIETLLTGKPDSDVSNYAINGRSLTKYSYDELLRLHAHFESRVRREKEKLDIQLGRKTSNTIKVRF